MRKQKGLVLLLLLLIAGVWGCLSVSSPEGGDLHQANVKATSQEENHFSPEEQGKSIAWSEPTAPHGRTVHTADNQNPYLLAGGGSSPFILDRHSACITFSVAFGISTLTTQFRILPNAP
ncbi:hypothetical protein [Pontibacter akesuensis]|uniref:Uncharacterized protein n=1 Tax=Pontibacter akesuensis TaxID=388950 RepID=A0A1I7KX41_9BACT|nr:hypothetical protein [Pontibacter akesuensis]SFV02000.1 hypothetical protein SAMN04487941_0056 [Pontibacter akesuensis]